MIKKSFLKIGFILCIASLLFPLKAYALTTNVPLINKDPGATELDSNNWTTVWGGKVSNGSNYFDTRLVGHNTGMIIRTQIYDSNPQANDQLTININGKTFTTNYGDGASAGVGDRCGNGACRGWTVDKSLNWDQLGGKPSLKALWDLTVSIKDLDSNTATWSGKISWGVKDSYLGKNLQGDTKLNIPVTKDATIGGGSECGNVDYPDYFPTWGTRNYGTQSYLLSQNQWDVADWPCFGKNVFEWNISAIPNNANITKAILNLSHFGENGYGDCYADDATKDTVYEIFELKNSFNETTISWDNSEIPFENIARTLVTPARAVCNNGVNPPFNRVFDVTEIVKRARTENRTTADAIMYTSAGQYHSGKQFYSKEGSVPPYIEVYYNNIQTSPTPNPSINSKMDVNKDGAVNLLDVIAVLGEIFK